LTVGDDDDEVRLEGSDLRDEMGVPGASGLEDGEFEVERGLLDGRREEFQGTSAGAIGLSDDREEAEIVVEMKGFEAVASQFGRAHEDNPHGGF